MNIFISGERYVLAGRRGLVLNHRARCSRLLEGAGQTQDSMAFESLHEQGDADWWRRLGKHAGSPELETVCKVQVDHDHNVVQSNCTVGMYKLWLNSGESLHVAVKRVDLDANTFAPPPPPNRSCTTQQS
jgi:hypothetical protein